jgi:8-oxo-dGTP pyrophosphatase MutT (NUDIX family)
MSGAGNAAALDAFLQDPDIARLATYLRARPGQTIDAYANSRFAAIALALRPDERGHAELLMIRRAEYEGDPWSGQIACPGGGMEPADADLEQTAIRETREETGVDLARDGRVLGTFDDVAPRTPVLPPVIIRPYVAVVAPHVTVLHSDEVAEAFWVPLDAVRRHEAWGQGTVRVRGAEREVPVFRYGANVVWGLTERVLRQMFDVLEARP